MLHEIGDVDALGLDLERARPDPAQLERVAHEPFEPFGLVRDRLEQLAPFLGLDARPRREERARRRLHRGQRRAEVVADRREEPARWRPTSATSRASRTSFLQPEPVDAGREPGDERFEQLAVGRREPSRRAREQGDARAVDAHVGPLELAAPFTPVARDERARLEPEQLGERVGRAVQRVVDVGAGEQPVRQVEPHLGLGLALERGAAQRRQPLHGPADQRGRRREHAERDDVVGAVDLERSGRFGEEPVQRQEPDERARQPGREAERPHAETP